MYTIHRPHDLVTNKPTKNESDNYLLGKSQSECYRYDSKGTLAIYFPKGNSTTNIILPQFDKLGIKYKLLLEADHESIYLVSEDDIHKIHSVLKFKIVGKNQQLKEYKDKLKEDKLKAKEAKLKSKDNS